MAMDNEPIGEVSKLDGSCHCGNIRFELQWPDNEIRVRNCGCSFCRKHAGAWTSHLAAKLSVAINEQSCVSIYQFGTKTADFYVCSKCGVVPFVACEIDDIIYAVVNVNAISTKNSLPLSSSATDFDGEDVGSRLDRRKKNWIPNVRFD